MNNSLELVIFYFVALLLNLKVIPVDPKKTKEEVGEILNLPKIDYIFSNLDISFSKYKNIDVRFLKNYLRHYNITRNYLEIFDQINYDSVYMISFTSGSTDFPKGVKHLALLWILNHCDGEHDLLDIAFESKINFRKIKELLDRLLEVGLIKRSPYF